MKKTVLFILFVSAFFIGYAQKDNAKKTPEKHSCKFSIDAIGQVGSPSHTYKTTGNTGSFLNTAVYDPGSYTFNGLNSKGGGLQFSIFFGKSRHFGLGIGALYCAHAGNMELDNFHVEYEATDTKGQVFRQLLTANTLQESFTIHNINIPVVARYQTVIFEELTFSVDAGMLVNLGGSLNYNTNAAFDYEAIYKFSSGSNPVAIYDNSTIPDASDWFITKSNSQQGYPSSSQAFFDTMRARGYNVALNVQPNNKSGKVNLAPGSVGFLVRPSVAYNLSAHVAVSVGAYYMIQTFKNTPSNAYPIMDINGSYNSPLKQLTSVSGATYGINIGFRYSFGK